MRLENVACRRSLLSISSILMRTRPFVFFSGGLEVRVGCCCALVAVFVVDDDDDEAPSMIFLRMSRREREVAFVDIVLRIVFLDVVGRLCVVDDQRQQDKR